MGTAGPPGRSVARRRGQRERRGRRTTYEAEFRLKHKDGHYIHVLSRGFPVRREPGGPVVRIVGTHFDLTERQHAEAERARTELLRGSSSPRRTSAAASRARCTTSSASTDDAQRGLGSLKRLPRTAELEPQVALLEAITQRLDRDVDHLVWELRPTALDDLGLRRRWPTTCATGRRGSESRPSSTGRAGRRAAAAQVETALYRIAQEALTNVARHSHASRVDVVLGRPDGSVVLIVEDNGVGFEHEKPPDSDGGFGLLGMSERAALVGATARDRIDSRRGTTILVGCTSPPRRQLTSCPESTAPLRVVLADDHVTVRHGLKLLIDNQPDMTVIAEASDGATAVRRALDLAPDVVVMDISMPGMNGLVATRKLNRSGPASRSSRSPGMQMMPICKNCCARACRATC